MEKNRFKIFAIEAYFGESLYLNKVVRAGKTCEIQRIMKEKMIFLKAIRSIYALAHGTVGLPPITTAHLECKVLIIYFTLTKLIRRLPCDKAYFTDIFPSHQLIKKSMTWERPFLYVPSFFTAVFVLSSGCLSISLLKILISAF
jgi:hypothetical protein